MSKPRTSGICCISWRSLAVQPPDIVAARINDNMWANSGNFEQMGVTHELEGGSKSEWVSKRIGNCPTIESNQFKFWFVTTGTGA